MALIVGTVQHEISAAGARPTSARSSSAYIRIREVSPTDPDRPSPSTSTETGVGSCPATAFHARQASMKAISWIDWSALRWCSGLGHRRRDGLAAPWPETGGTHFVMTTEQYGGSSRAAVVAQGDRSARRVADVGAESDVAELLYEPLSARALFGRHRPVGCNRAQTAHYGHPLDRRIKSAVGVPDDRIEMRPDAGLSQPPTPSPNPSCCQSVAPFPAHVSLPNIPVGSIKAMVRITWRGRQRVASRRSARGSQMSRIPSPRAPRTAWAAR